MLTGSWLNRRGVKKHRRISWQQSAWKCVLASFGCITTSASSKRLVAKRNTMRVDSLVLGVFFLGCMEETFEGSEGMGDVVLTCHPHSLEIPF